MEIRFREISPEPSLEPPEDKIMCNCDICGGEIYDGELWGVGDEGFVCIDCARDKQRELSDAEVFHSLGMRVCYAVGKGINYG